MATERYMGPVTLMKQETDEINQKMATRDNTGSGGTWLAGRTQHLVHPKHMLPDRFEDGKEKDWRKWRNDMEA